MDTPFGGGDLVSDSIRIACFDYQIVEIDPREANVLEEYGSFSPSDGLIRVESGLPADQMFHTLIHEILHGVFAAYYGPHEDEEELVGQLSVGIAQVVRDNPRLVQKLGDLL